MDASVVKNRRGRKWAVSYSGKHKLNGIKRHMIIDANGTPLGTKVTQASHQDQTEALNVLDRCTVGNKIKRPKRCGLDKGYDSDPIRLSFRKRKVVPCIPFRNGRVKPSILTDREKREQKYNRQRWKVERSFNWINNSRRINQMYERTLSMYDAFLNLTCIRHYLRILDP